MTVSSITPLAAPGEAFRMLAELVRDHGTALPAKCFDAIANYYPSPVDGIVNAAEAVYAAAGQATAASPEQEGFAVAAVQLADFCVAMQWHEIGQTDRGVKISGAGRRLVGLGSQDPALDPTPLAQFAV